MGKRDETKEEVKRSSRGFVALDETQTTVTSTPCQTLAIEDIGHECIVQKDQSLGCSCMMPSQLKNKNSKY